ncbi:synaptonemal complex protein 1 isoform X2 [Oryzias melastigma]|nr:synaptonemal complex protein 1 isoform X2 [Oryzias melastigma]
MERDRDFNFKLLVPLRMNTGQVNVVRPKEKHDNSMDCLKTIQQGHLQCFDEEKNMPFNTNVVASTKPNKPDLSSTRGVSPLKMAENMCSSPGELYSKLFDEIEKIKFWKVKVESETAQQERKLQESKITIETQRKAIQELQFGNENLSIKLEEQIGENEDLRNKNSATRNLCNILKETFQWSSEKMQLFESEREETHHLFMENSENIKKIVAAFQSLSIQVEADQQEMQKVKDYVLQFEGLKEVYHQEHLAKEEEITGLQTRLQSKEHELQTVLLSLDEIQKHCKDLEESTNQQAEHIKNINSEKENILQKLNIAEQQCKDSETKVQELEEKLSAERKKNEEGNFEMERLKEHIVQHKGEINALKATVEMDYQNMETLQKKMEEQNEALKKQVAIETEKSSELEMIINTLKEEMLNLQRLKDVEQHELLKELETKSAFAAELMNEVEKLKVSTAEIIKEKEETELKCQHKIADMITLMEKHKSQYDQMVKEKEAELEEKTKKEEEAVARAKSLMLELSTQELEIEQLKKQMKATTTVKNKMLKKQIAVEITKSKTLNKKINSLKEELQKVQRQKDEEHQKLLENLESKSKLTAELMDEVENLRKTAAEAFKDKEETELKCQHKIADMITLMEKHKSQYDRMVEEKEAEFNEKMKKEEEAVARAKSLQEMELSAHKLKIENLKNQLQEKTTEKENMQKKLTELQIKLSDLNGSQSSRAISKQSTTPYYKQERQFETPEVTSAKKNIFDFTKTIKTPSRSSDGSTPSLGKTRILNKDQKTPGSAASSINGQSKIKSYRIRTPPLNEKTTWWEKGTIELDPKSEDSDHLDLLTFANGIARKVYAPKCKVNFSKKIQSPMPSVSPGFSLKLAAMKRMRDAGWTAVTGLEKRQKTKDKIFA